jgi:hypothetical protein
MPIVCHALESSTKYSIAWYRYCNYKHYLDSTTHLQGNCAVRTVALFDVIPCPRLTIKVHLKFREQSKLLFQVVHIVIAQ